MLDLHLWQIEIMMIPTLGLATLLFFDWVLFTLLAFNDVFERNVIPSHLTQSFNAHPCKLKKEGSRKIIRDLCTATSVSLSIKSRTSSSLIFWRGHILDNNHGELFCQWKIRGKREIFCLNWEFMMMLQSICEYMLSSLCLLVSHLSTQSDKCLLFVARETPFLFHSPSLALLI